MSEQRLIDGNKLESLIRDNYNLNYGETLINPRYFMDLVEDAPTIEAAPVVHGKWVRKETGGGLLAICNSCKYPVSWWHRTNFCPHCGARMDGDRECL